MAAGEFHVFIDGDHVPVHTCQSFVEAKWFADLYPREGTGLDVMICLEGANESLTVLDAHGNSLVKGFTVDDDDTIEAVPSVEPLDAFIDSMERSEGGDDDDE